ncbi:MAG: autotransporter-associated beta strand repeat-containing protein [Luteolibacter sp.]
MNPPKNNPFFRISSHRLAPVLMAGLVAVAMSTHSAKAAPLTWDADAAAGIQTDGAGAWLDTAQWWDGAANLSWVSGSDAVFGNGGASGAVTLASPTTANTITFNVFTGTYTLGTVGQTLTLNGGIILNLGSDAATFVSPIAIAASQNWTNSDDSLLTVANVTNTGDVAPFTITADGSGTGGITFGGIISNGGSTGKTALTVNTTGGTTTLAGANTYSGDTTLTAGTVQGTTALTSLTPTSPFGASALKLNGGILQLRASGTLNATTETITFGNNVTMGADTTIDVNRPGITSTNKRPLLGTLSIGANTLNVTGGNGYQLSFGATTLTGNAIFSPTTAALNLTSVGDGGNAFGFTKTGTGVVVIAAGGTYTGTTTIENGTLNVSNATALGNTATSAIALGNATTISGSLSPSFLLGGTTTVTRDITVGSGVSTAGTYTIGSQNNSAPTTMSGTVTVNRNLTVNAGGAVFTLAGNVISGSAGTQTVTLNSGAMAVPGVIGVGTGTIAVTKTGGGTATLTGANTYTGGTTVTAGTLTVGTGGTLGATTGALAVNNPNTGAGTSVALNLATAVDTTVGSLSGTLSTPSSLTNTATINNGGSGRNFIVNQTVAGTYVGAIAGAGNFILGGLSTNILSLNGASSYTGTTTIESGTISAGNATALGNATSAIALGNANSITNNLSPTLFLNNPTTLARDITVGASNAATTGTYAIGTGNANSAATINGAVTLNQNLTVSATNLSGNSVFTLAGSVTSGSTGTQTVTFDTTHPITASTVIGGGTGTIAVTKMGAGTATLSGANTYTGATTVSAGTLSLQSTYLADASTVTISDTAFLNLNYAGTDTVTGLTLGVTPQLPGVYGALLSGAQFETARITGTGRIQVGAVATGYAGWAAANAPGQTKNQDHDNDGVANGIEYFMGLSGSGFTANPALSGGTVTWTKGGSYTGTYGTDFLVQSSTDLVNWTIVPVGSGALGTVANNAGSVTYTPPTGDTKRFGRLVVNN